MDKTKIDWCDSTWNPVTGCLHGCEYCYARGIAKRFGGWTDSDGDTYHDEIIRNDEQIRELDNPLYVARGEKSGKYPKAPYPYDFIPTLHRYRLNEYIKKKGRNIFVCSMADLFGEWVPDSWIEEVFKACEEAPQHNYLFLTKNPQRYFEYGVDVGINHTNLWYGTTISTKEDMWRIGCLPIAGNVFLSIEPILEDLSIPEKYCIDDSVRWVIIGAETGRRKDKVIPKREWIEDIVKECRKADIPIFMKASLADIWGKPLIQDFPDRLKRSEVVK